VTTIVRGSTILWILAWCLWSVASLAHAGATTADKGLLTVDVADASENAPIPYASVYVHNHLDQEITVQQIGKSGRFEAPLAPDWYDVFVTAAGFTPVSRVVSIRSGQTIRYAPRLRADLEHMER